LPIPENTLDLELGWRRTISDLSERRAFVRHPFLDSIIATRLDAWLAELEHSVVSGEYRPDACRIVLVPKPYGHIRPGADLSIADQVVYNAIVEQMRQPIVEGLGPNAGSRDYSYHLRENRNDRRWFEAFFARWQAFDRDSVAAIDDGAEFVVVADVAGFYENIDLYTLRSDLNGLGVNSSVLAQAMECLHRWTRVPRRGLPQGSSPSDVLAKVYLRSVDLALVAEGFDHRRWVDDFRVFCLSEADARRAIVVLADALGRRGLVLQTAKTRILTAAEAREEFSEVPVLLNPIQGEVAQALARGTGHTASYLPPWVLDEVLSRAGAEGAIEILRSAFQNYFIAPAQHFNKSLFHYLLSRLGAARDATYATEIVDMLQTRPEEFDDIADYCTAVGANELLELRYIELRANRLLPYPYLCYQFLRWRLKDDRPLSGALRTLVRTFAFEAGEPWYVRAASRSLLGKFGDSADLESLEAAYANAQSDIERAEIVCALQRMEIGRRNALYGRAAGDGRLASQAVRLARAGGAHWCAC